MAEPIRYVVTAEDQGFFAEMARVREGLSGVAGVGSGVAAALGAIGIGAASLAILQTRVMDGVRAMDDLDEAAQGIGVAAAELSSWQISARAAGVSQEALTAGISKFNTVLEAARTGNKAAGETVRALGIDLAGLRDGTVTTSDALRIAADRLAGYRDGFEKTALARDAFGKGGGAFISFLNQGSEGLTKFTGASQEAIREAVLMQAELDKAAAKWDKFWLAVSGYAAKAFNTVTGAGGFDAMSFEEQRKAVVDTLAGVEKELAGIPREDIGTRRKFLEAEVKRIQKVLAELEGKRPGTGIDAPPGGERPPVRGQEEDRPAQVRAEADAYTPLVRAIRERISVMEAEAREGEKLSEVQRFAAKTLADIEAGYIKLNPAQKAAVTDYLGEAAALDQLAQAREADRKALEDFDRATRDYLRAQEQQREGINALIQSHLDEITTLSGTREEIARMQAERELERLGIDKTSEAYQRYLDLLVDLKGQRAAIEENRRVWQSINEAANDAFIEIYKGGQGVFDRLKNTLERGLLQLLYEMTVKKWLVQIETQVNNQSGGDIFGWLIKLIGAAASGGSSAGADTAGAAGSTGGDAFGGQTWSAKASDWSGVMGSAKSGGLSVNYNIGQVGSGVSRADVVAAMEETRAATKADLLDGMARGKYRMAASTHG